MKTIDLHIHSNYSDGNFSVKEIVQKSQQLNVEYISIVDHDTLDGVEEFIKEINSSTINGVVGVEISSYLELEKGKFFYMHILGYGFDYKNASLNKIINRLKDKRVRANMLTLKNLEENGHIIPEKAKEKININKYCRFKRHILDCLRKYADYDFFELRDFARYLSKFSVEYDDVDNDDYEEDARNVIKAIKEAGGISVLAHPHEIEADLLYKHKVVDELVKEGLDGIEIFNSDANRDQIRFAATLTRKHNLLYSVGTDFHKEEKYGKVIGHGFFNKTSLKNCTVLQELINDNKIINNNINENEDAIEA